MATPRLVAVCCSIAPVMPPKAATMLSCCAEKARPPREFAVRKVKTCNAALPSTIQRRAHERRRGTITLRRRGAMARLGLLRTVLPLTTDSED